MATNKQTFTPGVTSIGAVGTRSTGLGQIQAQKASNITYISYDKIKPNDLNKRYDQIDLESLSYSIEDHGLYHNIVIITTDIPDEYRLISGERRWRAIGLLRDRNPERFEELFPGGLIPAKVQTLDSIDEEIALIAANSEVRSIDTAGQLSDIRRLTELYAVKEGVSSKTELVHTIAEQLNKSERHILRYMDLDKLVPELMEAFKSDILTITLASKIAKLGETEQLFLVDTLQESGLITEDDYTAAKMLQEEKETVKQTIETREQEINVLETMLEKTTSQEEVAFIETKITEKKNDIQAATQSMSRREKTKMRKIAKATRALGDIEKAIEKLNASWDVAKNDITVSMKLELLQMKLNNLKK